MCGWRRYRAADRCGGCGCDLADVLGGLFPVVSGRSVAGHAGKRTGDADGRHRMRRPQTSGDDVTCVRPSAMRGPGGGVDASVDRVVAAYGAADPTAG